MNELMFLIPSLLIALQLWFFFDRDHAIAFLVGVITFVTAISFLDNGWMALFIGGSVAWLLGQTWVWANNDFPPTDFRTTTKQIRWLKKDGRVVVTFWLAILGIPWLPIRSKHEGERAGRWFHLHFPCILWVSFWLCVLAGTGFMAYHLVIWFAPAPYGTKAAINLAGLAVFCTSRYILWERRT